MNDLTVAQLAALHPPLYGAAVKKALRDDEKWIVFLDPILIERTRDTLVRMVTSIDSQIERYGDAENPQWLRGIKGLRRFVKARLDAMAPSVAPVTSGNREAKAWRIFSAKLVEALAEEDYPAIDRLQTPYGGLTARQWLINREEKQAS